MALYWCQDDIMETYNDEPYGPAKAIKEDCPMSSSHSVANALGFLEVADVIVGHNIIGFDIPIIKKFYPWFDPSGIIVDTLLLSRLYHPDLFDIDKTYKKRKKAGFKQISDNKLLGRHSLEAYGYRLNESKGDFSKSTDWKKWSQEMEDYCKQDVTVTTKLWKHFHPYLIGSN